MVVFIQVFIYGIKVDMNIDRIYGGLLQDGLWDGLLCKGDLEFFVMTVGVYCFYCLNYCYFYCFCCFYSLPLTLPMDGLFYLILIAYQVLILTESLIGLDYENCYDYSGYYLGCYFYCYFCCYLDFYLY